MAEFCKECFMKDFADIIKDDEELMISKDLDLCEGCEEFKPVVIKVVKRR